MPREGIVEDHDPDGQFIDVRKGQRRDGGNKTNARIYKTVGFDRF